MVIIVFPFGHVEVCSVVVSVVLWSFLFFLDVFVMLRPGLLVISGHYLSVVGSVMGLFVVQFSATKWDDGFLGLLYLVYTNRTTWFLCRFLEFLNEGSLQKYCYIYRRFRF